MYQVFRRTIAALMFGPVLALGMPAPVHAGIVGPAPARPERARIEALVERALTEHGVDPAQASVRARSLSDEEVQRVAVQIEQLPAGGADPGTILYAIRFLFLAVVVIVFIPIALLAKAIKKASDSGAGSTDAAGSDTDSAQRHEPASR